MEKEKKITREDERKLFEAYEVLDKICNGHNIINDLCKEKINKVFDKLQVSLRQVLPIIYSMRNGSYLEFQRTQMKLEDEFEKMRKEMLDE